MKWVIHYDIVAFAMIAVVLVVYLTYNHLNTLSNRVYKRLLIVSLCSVVTDIASAYACSFCTENQIVLNYVVNILHFLVQNFVPCLYCLFAYDLTPLKDNINAFDILPFQFNGLFMVVLFLLGRTVLLKFNNEKEIVKEEIETIENDIIIEKQFGGRNYEKN